MKADPLLNLGGSQRLYPQIGVCNFHEVPAKGGLYNKSISYIGGGLEKLPQAQVPPKPPGGGGRTISISLFTFTLTDIIQLQTHLTTTIISQFLLLKTSILPYFIIKTLPECQCQVLNRSGIQFYKLQSLQNQQCQR